MRILYISTRSPYPRTGGREFMIAQSLSFISQYYETHLLCFHGKSDVVGKDELQQLGLKNIAFVKIPNIFNFIKNVFFLRKSLQECLYFSNKNKKMIDNYIAEIKPNLIICDMARTAQFISKADIPYLVDLDDILSKRYEKMLAGNNGYSVLGTYGERLPSILKRIEHIVRGNILKYEMQKIKSAELLYYKNASGIILTSEKEACYLNNLLGSNKAVGIPQSVNVMQQSLAKTRDILFIGNLTTAQNIASLKYIVDVLLPEVELLNCDYRLHVVGRCDERALEIANNHRRVKLHGFVDNYKLLVANCRMSIGHVSFGTGIKTKILDTLALGLPTVTNSVGAEGLRLENNVNIVISDDPRIQAAAIHKILISDSYASQLSFEGQKYVSEHHSFKHLQSKYLGLINSVIKKEDK